MQKPPRSVAFLCVVVGEFSYRCCLLLRRGSCSFSASGRPIRDRGRGCTPGRQSRFGSPASRRGRGCGRVPGCLLLRLFSFCQLSTGALLPKMRSLIALMAMKVPYLGCGCFLRWMRRMDSAAGVTPGMRAAWSRFSGWTLSSFSAISAERPWMAR